MGNNGCTIGSVSMIRALNPGLEKASRDQKLSSRERGHHQAVKKTTYLPLWRRLHGISSASSGVL